MHFPIGIISFLRFKYFLQLLSKLHTDNNQKYDILSILGHLFCDFQKKVYLL